MNRVKNNFKPFGLNQYRYGTEPRAEQYKINDEFGFSALMFIYHPSTRLIGFYVPSDEPGPIAPDWEFQHAIRV